MSRKTSAEVAKIHQETQDLIIQLWHDHEFGWPREIARLARLQGMKCSSYTALKLYPFERPIGLIRQDQAVRALHMYPGLNNRALERRICISDNTIGKARRFLHAALAGDIRRAVPPSASTVMAKEMDAYLRQAPVIISNKAAKSAPSRVAEHVAEPPPLKDTNIGDMLRQRGAVYGHPLDNFHDIAGGSEIISQCADPEVRVALNLIWVKVCRLIKSPDHLDSIRDIAGYAGTIEMLHTERKRRE
jgi:hypothetical protein